MSKIVFKAVVLNLIFTAICVPVGAVFGIFVYAGIENAMYGDLGPGGGLAILFGYATVLCAAAVYFTIFELHFLCVWFAKRRASFIILGIILVVLTSVIAVIYAMLPPNDSSIYQTSIVMFAIFTMSPVFVIVYIISAVILSARQGYKFPFLGYFAFLFSNIIIFLLVKFIGYSDYLIYIILSLTTLLQFGKYVYVVWYMERQKSEILPPSENS